MFSREKIYMPVPQQLARGDRMGRGPYEKSGMIEDTGLPPGKEVVERFEIPYPTEELEKDGKTMHVTTAHDLNVEVKLWYLPFGTMEDDPFLWHEYKTTVHISTEGK